MFNKGYPTVLLTVRAEKVKDRAEFSKYLISPTKFKFEKLVRIVATVWRFLKSFKSLKGKLGGHNSEIKIDSKFQMCAMTPVISVTDNKSMKQVFAVFDKEYLKKAAGIDFVMEDNENVIDTHRIVNLKFGIKKPGVQFKGKYHIILTDNDYSRSLKYLYKEGSDEVKEFNKIELVKKR